MNKKGYIPPLAFALLVFLLIVLMATAIPAVRQTLLDILHSIFG